ncbi:MAG: hypothetical protein UV71_C0006G0018 [Microgenomates group bacterium GW2011_GWC1_43_13]|uniref:Prepilin-type N-terminal cleavage/methylation domain-containing protein n=3 Tax=Candidatus Woeseibacteriota TaxID=1752722 RepID=A0A837I962_9BACT|nr:MAG: hypothetical protein UV71_C0006G0018 [Microgenomates group bacterium GW2011_GWC1_43_13]KKT32563.1 MAG: hypothetical protein UW20_C0012G0009 [Candidatus Woesebacteria bacterium GW2011_GWB1_44_11]KKT54288.1 MAG: hypothetical protein UW47_C0007G0008 [Candidatus Woesebacteria bacterium GW2011_GWA1_44_23]OGM76669.1 MAG: hypothetical protein A2208_03110 [Candidatus Woesebacteria bacterium RIFOXYA1_FULL_43_16]OGM83164.1 MAG: hypothetical protein A2394_02665 [Candidatus Woesebacteria bacterium 
MRNSKFKNSPDLSLLTFGYQRGQSLFELVVAIAISALIVVAMVSLATNSIKNSQFSKNKALASSYAQQATEWLRGERDSDFVAFKNNVELSMYPSKRCLNNLVWTINQCGSEIMDGTPFKREVIFKYSDGDTVINADITVSWTDSGGTHDVRSSTNFSNWQ